MKTLTRSRLSAGRALRRFGFKQTLRGALIVGTIAGLMMGAQGAAYAKAFPDAVSRQKLVTSLESVSAVNFLSGEIANAATPASYAIYKSLPLMVIVSAVWGSMATTRLLRGNEEDGRLELLSAGMASKRRASGQLLAGFAGSFVVACAIAFVFIAALGASPQVHLSAGGSALMVAAVFLPGLFFGALGVLTSQLASTRSRAVLYGLVPLLILFVIRGTANSVASVDWLKKITPFGWSDLLNPVLHPHVWWMLPSVLFAVVFIIFGLLWAGRRDLGAALIKQSDAVEPRYYLLDSPLTFAIRRSQWTFVWWAVGVIAYAAFFAALANFSVNLANDSSAFRNAFASGSEDELKLMFIGFGTVFTVTALLIMATLNLASIRGEEAKGYLVNLLVQPVRRVSWLVGRLSLAAIMFVVIALVAGFVTWAVAWLSRIDLNLWLVMQGAVSLVGPLALTLGIGVFFYGYWPRLAVAAMAVFVGWAFVVDILKSFFHLSGVVTKTSFMHYVPSDPSKTPGWVAILWLLVIGLGLAALGIARFSKRDIVSE